MHLLYTNDLHNQVQPLRQIDSLRQSGSLLLDGGDAIAGSNTAFCWNEPILSSMRSLGYAAMAMGNREFHYWRWLQRWREQEREFPLLACNLIDLRRPQWSWRPWVEVQPGVIAVGVTPVQYPQGSLWESLTGFRFLDPGKCLPPLLEELRPRAQVLILLSHLGLPSDLQLAERGLPLDLLLSAHSHDITPEPLRRQQLAIVQTGAYGHYLGELDFEPGSRHLRWQLHPCQ